MVNFWILGLIALLFLIHSADPHFLNNFLQGATEKLSGIQSPETAIATGKGIASEDITLPIWMLALIVLAFMI